MKNPTAIQSFAQRDVSNVFFRCVEDSNEAIMVSDRSGTLIYVNPAWERIYGFGKGEALGQTPRILHSGHHSAEFYQKMWASILDPAHGAWKGEVINRAKDGRLVPVLLAITAVRGPDGEIVGHMGIALDITSRKELEAKVVHQERLASVGLIASGLAHEVGTPLGVVRGRTEILLMQVQDPAARKHLEVILTQTDRITKLIRSLLRVSREMGETSIQPTALADVVGECLSLVGQHFREANVAVRVFVADDLKAMADRERLEQVLLNLLTNSIHAIRKATRDGRKDEHFLEIRATRRKTKVALEVQDSGCGIPSQNMSKLFKPFFTTKDVGEGTGLGLAIVSQLVAEMKGEITVSSEVDRGTVFTLVLDGV